MFLSVHHKPMMREAMNYVVIDKDLGVKIPRVIWANDETGRYRQALVDKDGLLIREGDHVKSKIFTGNIKLKRIG